MRGPIRSIPKRCGRTSSVPRARSTTAAFALAANVYYYTYEDLQVNVPGTGGGIVVDNVGKVDGWGLESTLEWIATDNIDLYLAGAYGDTEAKKAEALCDGDSACDGKPLPQVPKYSGSAVDQRAFPGARRRHRLLRRTLRAKSHVRWSAAVERSGEQRVRRSDAARRISRATSGWSAIVYVENVTDEVSYDGVAEGGDTSAGALLRPEPSAHGRPAGELGFLRLSSKPANERIRSRPACA